MKIFSLTGGFARITWPIAREVIGKKKLPFAGLILLSICLGTIPTLKSELEAAFLQQSADFVQDSRSRQFSDFLASPPNRLQQPRNDMDAIEEFAHRAIGGFSLRNDLWIYAILVVFTWLLSVLIKKLKAGITIDLFTAIRDKGFKSILEKEPSELPEGQQQTGKNANAVHQGTMNISATAGYIIDAVQYLVTLTTALYLLAKVSILFTGLFLLLLAIQVAISFIQNKSLKKERNELDQQKNALSAYTNEILSKKEILLAYDQGDKYREKLNKNSKEYAAIDKKLEVREEFFSGLTNLVSDIDRVLIPIFVVFAILELGVSKTSKIGDIYFVISLFTRLNYPALSLLDRYTDLKKSEAISESFLAIIDSEAPAQVTPSRPPDPCPDNNDPAAILFSHVNFGYAKEKKILYDCSLRVPRHKITVLLGPSGCGKTTIARLILGYWKIQSGAICINGRNIDSFEDKKELRKLLSYVSQEDHIVEESVRENLNWPADGQTITDAEMLQALASVEMHQGKITPDILDELAKELSGGEQQRLSLARILLDDSDIIIVDEPLTGVDVYTINKILPRLAERMNTGKSTFLVITHKSLFIKYAHHVILLDEEGINIEEGSPAELLAKTNSKLKDLLDKSIEQLTV